MPPDDSSSSQLTLLQACRQAASPRTSYAQLQKLGKQVRREIQGGNLGTPIRVAILSSFLVDIVADVLPALFYGHGLVAEFAVGPYGGIATEILGGGATLSGKTDLTLILPSHRDLAHFPALGATTQEAQAEAQREAATWKGLWDKLAMPVVQVSFDPPPLRALGELDGFLPGGALHHVRAVNQLLGAALPARAALVDGEALAGRIGGDWHDAAIYHLCKQPFGTNAVAEIADTLAATAAGLLGKSRKVLVLDLDNTLWGGIIGDAGLNGIVLGKETAEGEAFVEIQNYAQVLSRRGIVLAVCSKNDERNAREPFRDHPAMVLREDDIACFVANFEDKATNLRRIAQALNVGLDSMVFLDDNPVERAWVAGQLPEVLVVDLPDDPAGYAAALERAKPFMLPRITSEDTVRNDSYRARTQTIKQMDASGDMDSFLVSLQQVAVREPVGPASLDRIVQLIGKTNQFKLNPSTFSADEIEANRDGVFAVRFKDKLQDYGITAVAVTRSEDDALRIQNWVMSCRVFSRRLENATLELIRGHATGLGLKQIVLNYQPSAKNGLVAEVLEKLGFSGPASGGRFVLDLAAEPPTVRHHIALVDT